MFFYATSSVIFSLFIFANKSVHENFGAVYKSFCSGGDGKFQPVIGNCE